MRYREAAHQESVSHEALHLLARLHIPHAHISVTAAGEDVPPVLRESHAVDADADVCKVRETPHFLAGLDIPDTERRIGLGARDDPLAVRRKGSVIDTRSVALEAARLL